MVFRLFLLYCNFLLLLFVMKWVLNAYFCWFPSIFLSIKSCLGAICLDYMIWLVTCFVNLLDSPKYEGLLPISWHLIQEARACTTWAHLVTSQTQVSLKPLLPLGSSPPYPRAPFGQKMMWQRNLHWSPENGVNISFREPQLFRSSPFTVLWGTRDEVPLVSTAVFWACYTLTGTGRTVIKSL